MIAASFLTALDALWDQPTFRPAWCREHCSYGDRTFATAGTRLWNSLPVQLRNLDITHGLFWRQLKRHLFFGKLECCAVWHPIWSALEKHLLTYLFTYSVLVSVKFLAWDVIYTSCAYAMMSVRLSVTEVHWRIIANLGFKFRSHFTAHWPPCCWRAPYCLRPLCCLRVNHLAPC